MGMPDCPDCRVNRWVHRSHHKQSNYVCLCCGTVFQGPAPPPRRMRKKHGVKINAKDNIYKRFVGSDIIRIAESMLAFGAGGKDE